jgi:ribonuclease P protein component
MDQRLKPDQRVRKRGSFQQIFKRGKFAKGVLMHVWSYEEKGAQLAQPKIGIVVSRKVDLRATQRNLWKRRIREAFRRNQNKIAANLSLLIQARKQEKIPSFQAIEAEMLQLLAKIGSLK